LKPQSEKTQMAGINVNFTRKSVRNINLRISRTDGEVMVSAPLRVKRELVESFVASRADWISRAQNRVLSRQPTEQAEYVSGERISYLGKKLLLTVEEGRGAVQLDQDRQELKVYVPRNANLKRRQTALEDFYRQELSSRLPVYLEVWQPIVGAKAKECRVRKMKSRWGSCNTRQARIWMSLELIKYPPQCIEYVLVHELTHLLEPSHNKRFHRLVGEAMPNWREHKNRLSQGLRLDERVS